MAKSTAINVFDPVDFSIEENEFLLSTLGQPPIIALRGLPVTVNPQAVRPLLERVYELVEQEKHSGIEWTGVEPLRDKINIYLEKAARWQSDRRRGAPRFPSTFTYDVKRRGHRGGPGADGGKVKTYFGKAGQRIPFAIELVPYEAPEWAPEWVEADQPAKGAGLKVDNELNRIECLVCNHTESFNQESRQSYNTARARMSRHLRKAGDKTAEHREVYTTEFGS
jgi:hypothetical protein